MREILRLEHISYCYEQDKPALQALNVSLYESQKVAVLGNNGAGKSTFFLCCNSVLTPQQGAIYLYGDKISQDRRAMAALRQKIGLVFQNPDSQLIAGNVEAEISFGPMNLKLPYSEVKKRVDDAICRMDLKAYRNRAPHYLSGGEKKRVSIADVLSMEPRLLLFDEPTASLDPANTSLFEHNLEQLSANGLGIVISTHDVDFVWKWAERILVFHQGRLTADDTPEKIFSDTELLRVCGLKKPLLYEAGEILHLNPLPRCIEDLKR